MKLVAVLLFGQLSQLSLKPWQPGAVFTPQDLAKMELHFQPVRAVPAFRLSGVEGYYRERLDDALLLGDLLFHAPKLLGPRAAVFGLSCATCHPGGASNNTLFVEAQSDRPGNVDLLSPYFYAEADDGVFAPRNISSLRGCAKTAPYRRDGSVDTLEHANALVVRHEFQQPLPQPWLEALSAYVARFELWPSPLVGPDGALDARAEALAREGERVFDAKQCQLCHPKERGFTDRKQHPFRHGEGKGTLGRTERFDTPTLSNLAETAPYFFDGSAPTLAAAVEQLDRRHALGLTERERAALVAYLGAVGAVPAAPVTWTKAERIRQALAWARLVEQGTDEKLWALCLDAMRHQARLAGDERLAAELHALGEGAPTDEARVRLARLRIGRQAARRD